MSFSVKNIFTTPSTAFGRLLLSILSGILLSLGWLSTSGLFALAGFVPLLILSGLADSSRRGFWRIFGYTSLSFGVWSGITTWWIWYATPIGPILSVVITIVLFGGVFMLYHYASKRSSRSLSYVILISGWIAAEYLYTVGQVSFPWLVLGNGFANDVRLIQWYEYTGVFGGSLWVLVVNILIYELIRHPRSRRKALAVSLTLALPITSSLVIYHTYTEQGTPVNIQIIQPNIDPYGEKFVLDQSTQKRLLCDLACEAPSGVDYVVMPETAIDDGLWEHELDDSEALTPFRELIESRYAGSQFILGATTYRRYDSESDKTETSRTRRDLPYWYDIYNTALSLDTLGSVGVHHKSKLVVGVEKMPFRSLTKHLDFLIVDLGGTVGQLGYDTVRKVFTSPRGIRSGTAICYESVYGGYFSEFARGGAELMFVITNDGWWGDTPGYRQHFSFSRLRAIETRRSIARSANTGISGFINSRGDVLSRAGWDVRESLNNTLLTNSRQTFYTRIGDSVARVSCYVFWLSMLYYVAYRYRRRSHLVP